jgi:hypothetical protein
MKVITHEHSSVHPPIPGACFAERAQEALVILIVAKDRFAPVAAIENLVIRARKFHASFSSHLRASLLKVPPHFHRKKSEIHRLTPVPVAGWPSTIC